MNTVEDRLRDALSERAAHSPIDRDAWAHTVARAGTRAGTRSGTRSGARGRGRLGVTPA